MLKSEIMTHSPSSRRWLRSDMRQISNDTYFKKNGVNLPDLSTLTLDWQEATERLRSAVKIKTVTYDEGVQDVEGKRDFLHFLKTEFPRVHKDKRVKVEVFPPVNLSILFTIKGLNTTKKPFLMMAHYDVVPAEVPEKWTHFPFDACQDDDDGYIYGRGIIDLKAPLIAILSLLEYYLEDEYWKPERSIMVFSGHDEEGLGIHGARHVANMLQERDVSLEFILDEGGMILRKYINGVEEDVAVVSVAEKGYLSVEIEARGTPGHSSRPPANGAISRLAKAITRIQENQMPVYFGSQDVNRRMLTLLSPYMPVASRFLVNSATVVSQAIEPMLRRVPTVSGMFHTTTAMTMLSSGVKENVMPEKATAICNHRIHPNDSVGSILELDQEAVKTIKDVTVRISEKSPRSEPSPVSPYGEDDAGYHLVKGAVHAAFPNVLVVPSITLGATDSRYFAKLTQNNNVYRFVPFLADKNMEDTARIHGIDERIHPEDFVNMIRFYHGFFSLADKI